MIWKVIEQRKFLSTTIESTLQAVKIYPHNVMHYESIANIILITFGTFDLFILHVNG